MSKSLLWCEPKEDLIERFEKESTAIGSQKYISTVFRGMLQLNKKGEKKTGSGR